MMMMLKPLDDSTCLQGFQSDWCRLGQIRHQSVTYGLMDLESITNPWLLKSDPSRSVEDPIGSI